MNIIAGIIRESWYLFMKMSPYLLAGFVVAGFLNFFLKRDVIFRHLGKPGLFSVLKAVLFGVPLPLCSCGVIPPAATLYKSGASRGSVVAFLISTPTTGIDSIFATYGLLGGVFMIFRLAASVFIGLIAGFIVDIFPQKEQISKKEVQEDFYCEESTLIGNLKYAFTELYASVAKWIFWGVLIGGFISFFVPDDFFSGKIGNRNFEYIFMLVVGVPLYVCATGSIPIAASLIAKGMSPGAGLIFLITGPATNTVTMLFAGKTLGKRSFIVYIITVVSGSLVAGFILDMLLVNYHINLTESFHKHSDFSVISYLASFILIVFGIKPFFHSVRAKFSKQGNCFDLVVPDISCNSCAERIKNKIGSMEGITGVSVDVKKKKVRICSTLDNREEIKNVLASIGYPVSERS